MDSLISYRLLITNTINRARTSRVVLYSQSTAPSPSRLLNPCVLQFCDHKTSNVCSHHGRNGFSPHTYNDGSCSIPELLSQPKVSKSHCVISQEPSWYSVRTLSCREAVSSPHYRTAVLRTRLSSYSLPGSANVSFPWGRCLHPCSTRVPPPPGRRRPAPPYVSRPTLSLRWAAHHFPSPGRHLRMSPAQRSHCAGRPVTSHSRPDVTGSAHA